MAVKKERVLSFIYQKMMREHLKIINLGLINPTTKLQLTYQGKSNSAYTTITGKENDIYHIVIGGKMVAKVAMLPDDFSSKKSLRTYIPAIKKGFKGLNYHEMGHVLFTDLTLSKILEYDKRYVNLLMNLFNILEDPIIEINISKYVEKHKPYDKSPRRYFDFLKAQLFVPMSKEYKEENTVSNFFDYILLLLRCGKKNIIETNSLYEKYEENLVPLIKNVLSEPSGTERQVKTIILFDWMKNNISELNWEEYMKKPEDLRSSPKGSKVSPMSSSGIGESDSDEMLRGGKGKYGSPEDESEKDTKEEEKEEEKEDSDSSEDIIYEDESVPDLDECFDDLLNASYSHEFVDAIDEYTITNEDELMEKLNEQLEKSKECVQNISKYLTLFKGRKKPRRTAGFTSGKLNIPAAMQDEAKDGCELKLFTRNIERGRAPDLAVSLVCDNSGSMRGTSSTLASISALALAQACEWSKIPFECCCFTKTCDSPSGTSITIIEKEFNQSFEKAKPFFAINDSHLVSYLRSERDIPTFAGNSEEVNLFHIWKKLSKVKHDTKLMFVFCDGATTGSADNLKSVIQLMENDGIHVVGVGLQAPAVAKIYPNAKVFNSLKEIQEGLTDFLINVLSKFATK